MNDRQSRTTRRDFLRASALTLPFAATIPRLARAAGNPAGRSAAAAAKPVSPGGQPRAGAIGDGRQRVDDVDPFIGTTGPGLRWMLFPGAAMPFGMVKLSPDNRYSPHNRPGVRGAGYDYNIDTILGFSHIHSWTMGGLLTMPTTGPLKLVQGPDAGSPESFRSRFRHETETASPGYYAVTLDDYGIRAELTSTTRAGFQRYTFPKTDQARILFALEVPGEYDLAVKNAVIRRVSDTEIEGESEQTNNEIYTFQKYKLHFVIRFSKPFDSMGGWVETKITPNTQEIAGKGDIGVFANYHTTNGEVIQVKTGISYVSIEQARLNLDTEMNRFGWDFDAVRKNANDTWNDLLKKIEVEGGSQTDRTKFYTNLYRSFVARTIFSDVNGKYVDPTGRARQLEDPESPMLGCDAFWNTFWNLNQLWGLVTPEILSQWVRSEIQLYDDGGWLSRGPAGLRYSGVMVAEHEIALLVGAWQKGIRNFDAEKTYAAIKHVQTTPGKPYYNDITSGRWIDGYVGMSELIPYRDLGYVPVEAEHGWTSLTLEYAYDDWCTAQMAKALGKMDDYQYFAKRAQNYRNIWDPSVGYFRPRHRDGTWVEDFLPSAPDHKNFIEGTAWQYTWDVPHDVKGLIGLMGKDEFVRRLNQGFEDSRPDFARRIVDMGNEQDMQAPWLFNYAEAPWLTQKWTREVIKHCYFAEPAGYVGDEDQGQMGSYFVLMAIGLFEMDGGCSQKPIYEIGSPLFSRIVVHLDKKYYPGRQFIIETVNNSPENLYIQSATLNGQPLNKPWIYHSEAVKGATLVLIMGPQPNTKWGSAPEAAPPQDDL
ncbi:MAG: GH92 family glycosyl hydrolase [Terriglobia bacterium]